MRHTAYFHLPGLFEFYDFYKAFLPLFYSQREWFYPGFEIGSIYGAPADCLWGGGRIGYGTDSAEDVFALMREYHISPRLTFSNSMIRTEHLSDWKCNRLCKALDAFSDPAGGVIVHSDLLLDYLRSTYPHLYFISSTTKVLTDFSDLKKELFREEFSYVVPDFRLNHSGQMFSALTSEEKAKVEFLCNECCDFSCGARKKCYENVSLKALGDTCPDHVCPSRNAAQGYRFSLAMKNPAFISLSDIKKTYLPAGFSQFKIEGRSLGSALLLEFILYYMTKPAYRINVREEIYIDSCLDLF